MRKFVPFLLTLAACAAAFGQAASSGQFMYIGTLDKKLLILDENKEEEIGRASCRERV